jgi:hypothetical protein
MFANRQVRDHEHQVTARCRTGHLEAVRGTAGHDGRCRADRRSLVRAGDENRNDVLAAFHDDVCEAPALEYTGVCAEQLHVTGPYGSRRLDDVTEVSVPRIISPGCFLEGDRSFVQSMLQCAVAMIARGVHGKTSPRRRRRRCAGCPPAQSNRQDNDCGSQSQPDRRADATLAPAVLASELRFETSQERLVRRQFRRTRECASNRLPQRLARLNLRPTRGATVEMGDQLVRRIDG